MNKTYELKDKELHLIIIWNNGKDNKGEIIANVNKRFDVRLTTEINWEKKYFAQNLRRFYGKNLPEKSNKEKECGIGPFTLIVFYDNNPIYAPRYTNQGVKIVNVNVFDTKEFFRKKIGKNVIHATNSRTEFEHDVTMLLHTNTYDLEAKDFKIDNDNSINYMPGSQGWDSIGELLYTINSTSNYVILRNFENYPKAIEYGKHSDIDLLCDNYKTMQLILNSQPTSEKKGRVQNRVFIGDKSINIDIRNIGDGYLDEKWQRAILTNRIMDKNGFYRPNNTDYLYSLIYHALVQKSKISSDYIERVSSLSRKTIKTPLSLNDEQNTLKHLKTFMDDNGYTFIEPKDPTVAYNYHKIGVKAGVKRKIHRLKHKVASKIKG